MKARTKAAKKKAKRGRPYSTGLPRRTASGRKSRAREHQAEEERDAMSTALEARMRHALLGHGEIITEAEARNRLRGFVLGLLHIDGKIDRDELSAGVWYAELVSRYYGLVGIPFPSARAQDLYSIKGYEGEISTEKARLAREISNRVMEVEGVILARKSGRQAASAVKSVCVMDLPEAREWPGHMIGYLKVGLRAIGEKFDCPDWRA